MTEFSDNFIEVTDLGKLYRIGGECVIALRKISFKLARGELCCITGTSGSGKSTLLNQMAGMEKPSTGTVRIGGTVISDLSENQLAAFRQHNIGFIFQSYNLMPYMTAVENVAIPLIFRGIDKKTRTNAAEQILRRVGLGDRLDHYPGQMSGGQQQRVGIARAFIAKPAVVFADEPTGNLDSKTTIDVMQMIKDFSVAFNQTIVLVTHDPEPARYADRIITLMDGSIVSDIGRKYEEI